MNGPEILHILRHELQHAVGRRGKPPSQRPVDVSPWLAMSVLQKAIRRGGLAPTPAHSRVSTASRCRCCP
jgi:hypothetical protein